MRIAIDIKHFKHGSSGIARYLTSIMDCLQEIDNKNEYFLFECRPSTYAVRNPKWRKILIPWKLSGTFWQQVLLPYHLRRNKIDVLWAPEQTCPVLFKKSYCIVTTIHDLVYIHYPHTCQLTTRIVYSILSPMVFKKSDSLVTVSEYIADDVRNTFKKLSLNKKIRAIPNGKPDWRLPSTYSPFDREDFLLFVGNLEPRKNIVNLIKAIIILKQRGLKINLHLAGPQGWKNKKIHEIMNNPEIQKQIIYLGYLSEEELKNEYLICKALVYPSIYEGFGLPVLEALCLDCLVLTSRKTVMEEIAKNAAIYFDPNDPEDIATAIEKIYDKTFDREKFLAVSREGILEEYSWRNTAEKLLDVLTETARCYRDEK